MHRYSLLFWGLSLAGVSALVACAVDTRGDSAAPGSASDAPEPPRGSGVGGASAAAGGSGGRPPERENEARYLAPVTTGKYLWAANPLSGRVALIDVTTLTVTLATGGNGPRWVAGLPEIDGRFGALVLNERSDDATLFRVGEDGQPIKQAPLETHADANAWAVSSSGRFAIAWTDALLREKPDPLETFQDITVLSLEPGQESAFPLGIGARPSAFAFSESEEYAYAVTEEGISVLTLGVEPGVRDLIVLGDSPLDDPAARDVSFGPEASYAIVRTEGKSEVGIVRLPTGTRTVVRLEGVVTDVDLSPNGDFAFAVLGNQSVVVQIPVDDADRDPTTFQRLQLAGQKFGAIALNVDASAAVLYSTVVQPNRVSLVGSQGFEEPETVRHYDLIAPVNAVFPSPDPRFAVAFQGPAVESRKAGAFSLLLLTAPRAPRIEATDAAPAQIAFSPEGTQAIVTVRSDQLNTFGAYLIDLPSQQTDFVSLASPPEAAGVVSAARRVYVAQSHPEGRITFISTEDRSVQTLTGFELAARIRSE